MVSNRRPGLKSFPTASARIPPWLTAASTRGARTPWSALICERFPEREINHKTAVDGHKKAQKAQNEKGGVATGVPDPVRVSARSRKFLNHEWTQRDIAATKVAQTSKSISISQNRCKPRRIFGARLCAQHQPQHGRDSNALRLGLRPQPRSILVAAWPRCAVSRVSKPAGGTISHAPPIWKSAIQQVWKPALRRAVAPLENL